MSLFARIISFVAAAAIAAAVIGFLYSRDMAEIRDRLAAGSELVQTSFGAVEYASWGEGPAVLVIHGAGGGYDQGKLMVDAFGTDGFRWIAASRFGYLRSALPSDASTAAQADAFAELLDALGIDKVRILAMSGGVPPALQFAIRHPQRTAALVLLSSAPFTPLTATAQEGKRPVPARLYHTLFKSDLPYWLLSRVAPTWLMTIFDARPELRQNLSSNEENFVGGLVRSFLPVTERAAGLANEAAAIDPDAHYALDEITSPTLVFHARDDGINDFSIGTYAADNIPGATLVPFDNGGHLLLGHFAEVRAKIASFFRDKNEPAGP